MPGISIVITTHNLGVYLGKCLKGLMNQTFQDFDVLIVDDASTDDTKAVIKRWTIKQRDRFNYIFIEDRLGVPGLARNIALDSGLVTGDYVLFLDGDDVYEEDMLECLYTAATPKSTDGRTEWADIVICAYDRVNEKTGKVLAVEMTGFPKSIDLPRDDDLLAFINTASWNKLWKREIIHDLRYSKYRVGEEVVMTYQAYDRSNRIVFVDRPLIHYIVREESVISNTDENAIWRFAYALKHEWEIRNENSRILFEVVIFLHIGLSMGIRAADNPSIAIEKHLRATERWFKNEFGWFRGNRFFRLHSLCKHGAKGVLIWGAYMMYRMHIFGAALFVYRKLRLNVKF